jgi:hypothetical protein
LLSVLVSQLVRFPGDTFDDLVDSTTQAVNYVQGTGPMRVSTVHYGHGSSAPPPDPFADRDTFKPRARTFAGGGGFR